MFLCFVLPKRQSNPRVSFMGQCDLSYILPPSVIHSKLIGTFTTINRPLNFDWERRLFAPPPDSKLFRWPAHLLGYSPLPLPFITVAENLHRFRNCNFAQDPPGYGDPMVY